jgi:cation diffusion facilitator CzcD-associated flavoprotein CzcO
MLQVLILATGFQVQSINERMRIIGKDSKEILGPWRTEGPKLYYGVNSSSIPNHFFLFGPNPVRNILCWSA